MSSFNPDLTQNQLSEKRKRETMAENKPAPPLPKVVMLGSRAVGKTHLCKQISWGCFPPALHSTLGTTQCTSATHSVIHEDAGTNDITERSVDYILMKTSKTSLLDIRFNLWDTGISTLARSLWDLYFQDTDLVLLVYDVTNEKSFEDAKSQWRQELLRRVPESPVIVVGTKCDLQDERVVSTEAGVKFASANGYMFFEVSAVRDFNVDTLLFELVFTLTQLQRSGHFELSKETAEDRIRRLMSEEQPPSIGCCVIL